MNAPEPAPRAGASPVSPEAWAQIEPLLDAALALAPAQRSAFVATACAGDALLRSELERMLTECDRGDALFDRPAAERFATLWDNTDDLRRVREALAGQYELERELGRGGMATVYLARDIKHRRPVAIKVVDHGLGAEVGAERFLREIELCASLRHPHILPLYDSGAANGFLFYVMPLAEGKSLRDRLRRDGRLPVDEALRFGCEIADALGYAHARGVVHRDIKPENILIEAGHPMVADFGIAHVASELRDDRLTRTGISLGTPAYMSPEQASAEPVIDERSDIYSLACVVYEMLVGEPPFTGPTAEAVLVQRFTQQPPRPSAKREGLARPVDDAIRRALARDPDDRFASAQLFKEALGAALHATVWPALDPAQAVEKSIAVLPFDNMSADPENEFFADGIAEEIINALARLPGLRVAARTSAFSFKGKKEDLRTVGEKLNVATVLEGSVRKAGGRVRITVQLIGVADGYHIWSERYDRELTDIFVIQDEIATAVAEKLKVTLHGDTKALVEPPTESVAAYELYLKGRAQLHGLGHTMREAVRCFTQAIALDPEFAHAHAALGEALAFLVLYGLVSPELVRDQATDSARAALTLAPKLADAHHTAGLCAMFFEFDWRTAEREFVRALEAEPNNVQVICSRALWIRAISQRDFAGSVRDTQRAVVLDPLSGYAAACEALSRALAGHGNAAASVAQRAVELDPVSFYARMCLFWCCAWANEHERAMDVIRYVLGVSGRHPWALSALAVELDRVGESAGARSAYSELLARASQEFIQPWTLALSAAGANLLDEAFVHAEQGLRDRDPFSLAVPSWPDAYRLRRDPRFAALYPPGEMQI